MHKYTEKIQRGFATVNHTLDLSRAKAAWPGAEPLLLRALSRITETASRGPMSASFGFTRRQSCSPVEKGATGIEVVDAVPRKGEATKRYRFCR